jgi:hypothetical protein
MLEEADRITRNARNTCKIYTESCSFGLSTQSRLIFVNDHTLGSMRLPSRTVDYYARSRLDQMFVDFSPGFIDVMDRLAERVTDRIVCPFSVNHDSFARLVRSYRALRARSGFRCCRACLCKRQLSISAHVRAIIVFFTMTPPFFVVDVQFNLRAWRIRRTGSHDAIRSNL